MNRTGLVVPLLIRETRRVLQQLCDRIGQAEGYATNAKFRKRLS